jgi:EpsI family protein
MSRQLRLAAVLLALLLPAFGLLSWTLAMARAGGGVVPLELPERLGQWSALGDEELAPDALALVEPDSYVLRLYGAPGRASIWVYAAVYSGRSGYGKGAHDPEVCYPAQGWEILRSREVSVPVNTAERFHARALDVHKSSRESVVLYWFQPARRWSATLWVEELLRLADAVQGRPQYAFVRLATPAGAGDASERELTELASDLAPAIRAALEEPYR